MKTKKKKRMSRAAIALVIGLIIILIPCAIYGGILIEAIVNTGQPIVGQRFDNDLNPAITDTDIANIQTKVSAIEGVEAVEINLPTGQLRVNVDVVDTLTKDEIKALVDNIYNGIIEVLPVDVYFKSGETMRMYDLAVNVYNFIEKEGTETAEDAPQMIYYQLTKNAMMEDKNVQLVSEPVDSKLVDRIYQEIKEAEEELAKQEQLEAEQNAENSEDGSTEETPSEGTNE